MIPGKTNRLRIRPVYPIASFGAHARYPRDYSGPDVTLVRGRDWPGRIYRPTAFRGLPPNLPFLLDATFLARLLDWPPTWPSLDAIHLLEPRKPSKIPGT